MRSFKPHSFLALAVLVFSFSVSAQVKEIQKPNAADLSADSLNGLFQTFAQYELVPGMYVVTELKGRDQDLDTRCRSQGEKLSVVLKVENEFAYIYEKVSAVREKMIEGGCNQIQQNSQVVRKTKTMRLDELYQDLSEYAEVQVMSDGTTLFFYNEKSYGVAAKSQSLFSIDVTLKKPLFMSLRKIEFFDSSGLTLSEESQTIVRSGDGFDLSSLKSNLSRIDLLGPGKKDRQVGVDLSPLIP